MKILGTQLAPNHLGAFIGILYAYGVFLGCIGVAWNWLWNRGMPGLLWWQFLLAPFAIGAAAFALEGMVAFCSGGFTLGHTASLTRRLAGKVFLVVLLVMLLLGWPMYSVSHP